MVTGSRRQRAALPARRTAVVLMCVCLAGSACASRLPRSEIAAAQSGHAVPGGASLPVTGPVDPSGTSSDAVRGSAPAGGPTEAAGSTLAVGVPPAATRSTETGAPAPSKSDARGPADPLAPANRVPIKIGSVGSITGLFGTVLKPILDGIQINVAAINRDGGINGHPVQLIVADDLGDPAIHLSRLREFVEKDKVIGFVNMPAATLSKASLDYLESKSMPYIDTDSSNTLAGTSPMSFTMGSSAAALNGAEFSAVSTLAGPGHKAGYIVCLEVQQCADYAASFADYAKRAGLSPVFGAKATLTSPDFTQNCLQARGAGVEFLFIRADPNSIKRIARDCARQGFLPRFVFAAGTTDATFPGATGLDGAVIPSQVFPFTATETAEEKRFQTEMARTRAADQILAGHALGWGAANVLIKALRQIGPADMPTTAGLLKGLWGFKDERLGGSSLPLTYRQGSPPPHAGRSCAFPMTLSKGSWVAPNGNAFNCLPG